MNKPSNTPNASHPNSNPLEAHQPRVPNAWVMVRFSALGDVTLTTGVLAYFHATQGYTFTVLTREAFAPLFEHHPAVNHVLTLPPRLGFRAMVAYFRALAQRFAGQGLMDLHNTPRTRLLALLWQGPVRRYPKYSLERRFLLLNHRLWNSKPCNATLIDNTIPQRYARALQNPPPQPMGVVPHVFLTPEERAEGQNLLSIISPAIQSTCSEAVPAGIKNHALLVALHPYATHANKEWPVASWCALMTALDARHIPYIVIGQRNGQHNEQATRHNAPHEQTQARTTLFPNLPATHDFTNRTTLRQTCALLTAVTVLVTGDSGPLHLASAVQTPVVALFGPTIAEWGFFPQGIHDTVLQQPAPCRPCSLHGQGSCAHNHICMRGISPEQVLNAIERVLPSAE